MNENFDEFIGATGNNVDSEAIITLLEFKTSKRRVAERRSLIIGRKKTVEVRQQIEEKWVNQIHELSMKIPFSHRPIVICRGHINNHRSPAFHKTN